LVSLECHEVRFQGETAFQSIVIDFIEIKADIYKAAYFAILIQDGEQARINRVFTIEGDNYIPSTSFRQHDLGTKAFFLFIPEG
jgi:hypothetical protein